MRISNLLKNLTVILLLVFTASGVVSAKVASGPQNLSPGLHQAESLLNSLPHLGWDGFSYDEASGSSVVAKSGVLDGANFAQKTFGKNFSAAGKFAGQTVDDVAASIQSGALKVSDVPIDYIVRNGNTLILNTRSSQALIKAGIPRSQWNAINRTGDAAFEARLTGQLNRNNLTEEGISTVRQSGGL